ncbi:MAG: nitroreductase [Methyloligellaceae bacterium]
MSPPALDLLLKRRSVLANNLGPPGPDAAQLEKILTAGARVPDHKKLCPWRFILFEGEARTAFGRVLADACRAAEPDSSDIRLQTEAARFERAPVVIAVISRIVDKPGVPEWEQILSAGAVCQNILVAAAAIGFSAQWLTEWYAFDEKVRGALGLAENERVAGFIYIGTAKEPPQERVRPKLDDIVTRWAP